MRQVIDTIKPEVVISVHTEKSERFCENFENVKILTEGEKFVF